MVNLEKVTKEALLEELKRREQKDTKPEMLNTFDHDKLLQLRDIAKEYIDGLAEEGADYNKRDVEQYAFEAVLEMYYGKDIFDWIGRVLKG